MKSFTQMMIRKLIKAVSCWVLVLPVTCLLFTDVFATTYNYYGNTFATLPDDDPNLNVFVGSRISGYFILASPLASSLNQVSILDDLESISFSNGPNDFNDLSSATKFEVTTDDSGKIIAWDIDIDAATSSLSTSLTLDTTSTNTASGLASGLNINSPGRWLASKQRNTYVLVETVLDNFVIELFDAENPSDDAEYPSVDNNKLSLLTIVNFLNYVRDGDYDNMFFHRNIPEGVLQGGGFRHDTTALSVSEGTTAPAITSQWGIESNSPIVNEFNHSNVRGTLAMAKLPPESPEGIPIPGGGPDSATSEWFINMAENSAILDDQNGGFTVFGRIYGGGAMENLIDPINALPSPDATVLNGTWENLPLINYRSEEYVLYEHFVIVTRMSVMGEVDEPRAVATDDTAIVGVGDSVVIDLASNDEGSDVIANIDPTTIKIVADPRHGTLTRNDDGAGTVTISYTHDGSDAATDSFDYTIEDDSGAISNVAKVAITVKRAVARNDNAVVDPGGNVIIDLAENDEGNDGIVGINLNTIEIVTQPVYGTLTDSKNDTGEVSYTQDVLDDNAIEDYFEYTIKDDDGVISNAARVYITINVGGISVAIEEAVPSISDVNGDGNGDRIPDIYQPNVASFTDVNDDYVTLVSYDGYVLKNVKREENPSISDTPAAASFDQGFFSFTLDDVGLTAPDIISESTRVEILLPEGQMPTSYYMYGPTPDNVTQHWYEFAYDATTGTGAVRSEYLDEGGVLRYKITLYFVDGERGDADLTPNGIILDPGGPSFSVFVPYSDRPIETGGGGGGGCSISHHTVHPYEVTDWWIVLMFIAWLGVYRKQSKRLYHVDL